jgi:hypothetical protein
MRMKTAVLLLSFVTVLQPTFADSSMKVQKERYSQFERVLKKSDYSGAERLLLEWQQTSPDDAELAVAWGNYYAQTGLQPLAIYKGPRNDRNVDPLRGGAFVPLSQPGTSVTVGYIDERPRFDNESLARALCVLRDAATTHPHRTDIWMGATHIQLVADDLAGAYRTLEEFAQYAHRNPKGLRKRFDEPLNEKASDFMAETLHSYALRGYNMETTAGLEFMRDVAVMAQKLYPGYPYAYNDEAVYYNIMQDDEKVLDCLLRAHKVQPKDPLVTMNIAGTYKNLKRTDKAREFFNLTIKLADDEQLKDAAREGISALDAAK